MPEAPDLRTAPAAPNPAPNPAASRWREYALLGLLAMLWGSSYLWLKIAVAEIPPVTLIASRVALGALFLLAVMAWYGIRLPRDRATWGALFVQSILNSTGAWVIMAWGQQFIDSSLASVLNSTSPLFVFLITYFVTRHESTSFARLAGALLGIAGVILIVGTDALAGLGEQVAGQLAALVGALMYAVASIYGKRFAGLSPPATAAGTMLAATAALVPASLIIDQPWTLAPPTEAIGAALMLGVPCTGLAMLLYFRLLRTLGSLGTASQGYLRASFGVVLGMIVLGEQITPIVGVGLAAALIGVALINLPERTQPAGFNR